MKQPCKSCFMSKEADIKGVKRYIQGHTMVNSRCRTGPATATAKSLQSCPTLCDRVDSSPPGYPVLGILQARTLEWVAISFSNAWKWKVKVKSLSHVQPSATPWTAAYQALPSMGFSRQEYWSGMPLRPGSIAWHLKYRFLLGVNGSAGYCWFFLLY